MCIQHLPGDTVQPSRELNRVADILMDGMEYVTLANGDLLRGTGRSHRTEDGVLSFLVSYNMFVLKQPAGEDPMESIEFEKGMVK